MEYRGITEQTIFVFHIGRLLFVFLIKKRQASGGFFRKRYKKAAPFLITCLCSGFFAVCLSHIGGNTFMERPVLFRKIIIISIIFKKIFQTSIINRKTEGDPVILTGKATIRVDEAAGCRKN